MEDAQEAPTLEQTIQVSASGSINARQLQDLINEALKDQLVGGQPSMTYVKPWLIS